MIFCACCHKGTTYRPTTPIRYGGTMLVELFQRVLSKYRTRKQAFSRSDSARNDEHRCAPKAKYIIPVSDKCGTATANKLMRRCPTSNTTDEREAAGNISLRLSQVSKHSSLILVLKHAFSNSKMNTTLHTFSRITPESGAWACPGERGVAHSPKHPDIIRCCACRRRFH